MCVWGGGATTHSLNVLRIVLPFGKCISLLHHNLPWEELLSDLVRILSISVKSFLPKLNALSLARLCNVQRVFILFFLNNFI